MSDRKYELDAYEQEIENNLEFATIPEDEEAIKMKLRAMAQDHFNTKSLMVHIPERDFNAIINRASSAYMPLSAYISSLIHNDALRA